MLTSSLAATGDDRAVSRGAYRETGIIKGQAGCLSRRIGEEDRRNPSAEIISEDR